MPNHHSNPEDFKTPWDYFASLHDPLSIRFAWHEQHLNERFLDLSGFIASISGNLEDERLRYEEYTFPLGFYEVEQPSRIRYVQLIFIFTIFERRIRALCKLVEAIDPASGPKLDELRGSLSDRVKELLDCRIGVNVGTLGSWSKVHILQKIRDCVVHCGGQINESRDVAFLRTLASQNAGIGISPWGYLYVDESFCETAQKAVLAFFDALFPLAHSVIRQRWIEKQSAELGANPPS